VSGETFSIVLLLAVAALVGSVVSCNLRQGLDDLEARVAELEAPE
jgi:hypothetical protein